MIARHPSFTTGALTKFLHTGAAVVVGLILLNACQSTPKPATVATGPSVPTESIRRFGHVYQIIKTSYVRQVTDDELFDNAIRGAANAASVTPDRWLTSPRPPNLPESGNITQPDSPVIPLAQIVRFNKALREIRTLRPDIPEAMLIAAATRGMVSGLGDQSSYLSPDDPGSPIPRKRRAGVGLELTIDSNNIRVVRSLPNSPAEKAGLRNGDHITRIDGASTHNQMLEEIVQRLQGDPGSPVSIRRIRRDGAEDELTLQRKFFSFDPVSSSILDQNYVHIRLWSIHAGTVNSLRNHLARAKARLGFDPRGIVLDLRGNTGGLLNETIGVADFFLSTGIICRTEGRMPEARQIFRASPPDEAERIPLVVLVDIRTASGAEVIAGSLQAGRRAYVIGGRTHGMGEVRTMIRVDRDFVLGLTTARLSTPAGPIHGRGVVPDLCTSADTPSTGLGEQCPRKVGDDQSSVATDRDLLHAINWFKKQRTSTQSP